MCAGLLFLVLSAAATSAVPGRPDGSWRTDPLWDDGNAEFSVYDVTWPRYGRRYAGRALLIVVKEPWAPDLDVKADRPRPDGFEVLKLNHVRDVPTGIYTYHQMASVYVRRDSGALRKIAVTSSEACGLSTADMTRGTLRTRSYFDGQGDREQPWPEGALPEDGLPLHLRDHVTGPVPEELLVFPTLMAGRYPPLAPRTFDVARSDAGDVGVRAGTFPAVELVLSREGERTTYVFEQAPPHRLLRLEAGDGTVYELAKSERIRYWSRNAPGGEEWLPADVR